MLSRVACLGQLKYSGNEGYWGPLERPLLTFAWMVNAVRVSLRDLVETIQVCMFLSGTVSRDRSDWSQLAVEYALHQSSHISKPDADCLQIALRH